MRAFLRRIDERWQALEAFVIVFSLSVIVLLGGAQILLRNFADAGWIWADAFIRHLVLVVGFLGGSLAAAKGRHITIDALSRALKGRWKRIGRIVTNLAAAIVAGGLCMAGIEFVQMERLAEGTLLNGWLPVWIIQAIIPYTFGAIAIRMVASVFSRPDSEETIS